MLAEMGLFSLSGEHYRFIQPAEEPSIEHLRAIVLPLEKRRAAEFDLAVRTDGDHYPTYPEQLSAMPRSKAVQLRNWFNEMEDPSRRGPSLVS